jgi:hypothetical protein
MKFPNKIKNIFKRKPKSDSAKFVNKVTKTGNVFLKVLGTLICLGSGAGIGLST